MVQPTTLYNVELLRTSPVQQSPQAFRTAPPTIDTASISPLAAVYASTGLTITFPITNGAQVDFSLEHVENVHESFSLSGTIRQEHSFSLKIVFVQKFEFGNDSPSSAQGTKLTLELQGSFSRSLESRSILKKEDILTFVRKLISRIQELSLEKDTLITGVVFETSDLKEIAELEHGDILKALYQLIESVNMLVRMRKLQEKAEPEQLVILHPQRMTWNELEKRIEENTTLTLSCSVESLKETSPDQSSEPEQQK